MVRPGLLCGLGRRVALAAVLALAGCGDDAKGGDAKGGNAKVPMVEVVANRLDGEPPAHDLAIRRLGDSGLGLPIPLTPVAGRPRVYEARGASDGPYLLALPDGWGPLYVVAPPRVTADGHPTKMNAGRAHTMYLTARTTARVLGTEWGARRVLADGGFGPPLPLKVEQDGNGWVLLRLRPEDWPGPIVVQGRFEDGGITEPILTTLKESGIPILQQLDPAPAGPLRVAVVGVPPGVERWVHLRVLGLPLDEVQQRPVRDGAAEFADVAVARGGLELRLGDGDDAPLYRVPSEVWARDGEVRLRDLPPAPRADARLTLPDASSLVRVQLRAEEDDSYGWVPARVDGDAVVVSVGPGAWRVLVQTKAGFASGTVRARADGTVEAATLGPVEAAVKVAGRVAGVEKTARLHWRRKEEGREVLAHGFVIGVPKAGGFDTSLPAGEYVLVIHGPDGPVGKPKAYSFPAGERRTVALDMPAPTPAPDKPR